MSDETKFWALFCAGVGGALIGVAWGIHSAIALGTRLDADVAKFIVDRECGRDHYSPDYGVIYRCRDGAWSVRDIELHYLAKYKAGK